MDEKFMFGAVLGMIGGALIVANSVKARKIVKDGQAQVTDKISELSKNSSKKKSSKS